MNPLNQTQQRILPLKQKFYALLSCLLHISYLFKNIYSIRKKQYLQKKANKRKSSSYEELVLDRFLEPDVKK